MREGEGGLPTAQVGKNDSPLVPVLARILVVGAIKHSQPRATLACPTLGTEGLPHRAVPKLHHVPAVWLDMIGLRRGGRALLVVTLAHDRWSSPWSHPAEGVPQPEGFRRFVPAFGVTPGKGAEAGFSGIHIRSVPLNQDVDRVGLVLHGPLVRRPFDGHRVPIAERGRRRQEAR
jgi:hypothetical protein